MGFELEGAEEGLVATSSDPLYIGPWLAQATVAAGNRSLPLPAGGGCLGPGVRAEAARCAAVGVQRVVPGAPLGRAHRAGGHDQRGHRLDAGSDNAAGARDARVVGAGVFEADPDAGAAALRGPPSLGHARQSGTRSADDSDLGRLPVPNECRATLSPEDLGRLGTIVNHGQSV